MKEEILKIKKKINELYITNQITGKVFTQLDDLLIEDTNKN